MEVYQEVSTINALLSNQIDYQRSFVKPDRLFTLSYRLEHNPNNSNYSNDITGILNYDNYLKESDNQAWGREHTFQVDYFEPLNKKNTLEVGTKYILRPNYSNTDTYTDHIYDPLQKNGLDYTQHITSAYGSYQYKMDKITLKGGVRAEYTINTGTFHLDRDESMYNKFFNFIPYATIGYAPRQGHNYRLGYSQRLSRPSIWHLNPYLDDKNPEAVRQGNPNLKSAISNVFDLSYSRFAGGGNYTISASAYFTDNPIQEVSTITIEQGKPKTFSTYDNIGNEQQYSLYFNGSKPFMNGKVRANINTGISYKTINGGSTDIKTQGWGGNASGGLNVNSWKDANINAYGGIYFSDVTLQSQHKSNYFYLLGISQGFLNKKFRVSLMVQNIFNPTISDRSESWGENFNSVNETIYKASSARLSLSWSFGKTITQVKKAKRTIENDDKLKGGESSGPKLN